MLSGASLMRGVGLGASAGSRVAVGFTVEAAVEDVVGDMYIGVMDGFGCRLEHAKNNIGRKAGNRVRSLRFILFLQCEVWRLASR